MERLFEGVRAHRFAESICFLCGVDITPGSDTVEHVIPKWLQSKFALWNVRVQLLNGTLIKYKDLVIPCCQTCNNVHLARVEQVVSASVLAGPEAVRSMDRVALMQWLLKIFFGFLYREIFLPVDRSKPADGMILSGEDMQQFQMLHYMLQSVRLPMTFSGFDSSVPASVFVFEVKDESGGFNFDYKDDVVNRCMCLRMGRVGILVAFDAGAQTVEGADYFPKYFRRALHPIQFDELAANLFAKARLLQVNPGIMMAETESSVSFTVMPFTCSPTGQVFADMTPEDVGEHLWRFTNLPREVVLPEAGRRITFLTNEHGDFRDMPVDGTDD